MPAFTYRGETSIPAEYTETKKIVQSWCVVICNSKASSTASLQCKYENYRCSAHCAFTIPSSVVFHDAHWHEILLDRRFVSHTRRENISTFSCIGKGLPMDWSIIKEMESQNCKWTYFVVIFFIPKQFVITCSNDCGAQQCVQCCNITQLVAFS